MTTTEAATLLNISDRRVRQLIQDGSIPAESFGKDWSIPVNESELRRLYERQRLTPREREVDDYCLAVLEAWMKNPPPANSGWLDEMVDKLAETTCDTTYARETKPAVVPAPLPTVDTADDEDPGDLGNAETWANEIHRDGRMTWLSKVGRLVRCCSCGVKYFPAALKQGRCKRCQA